MKKTLLLPLLLLLLVHPAFALFSDKEDWVTKLVETTPECIFDQCHSTYEICNSNWFESATIGSGEDIDVYFQDKAKNQYDHYVPWWFEEQVLTPHEKPVYKTRIIPAVYEDGQVLKNGTVERILKQPAQTTKEVVGTEKELVPEYKRFSSKILGAGECANITLRAFLKPGQAIDNILKVDAGIDGKFTYPEYAWFNTNYLLKNAFNISEVNSTVDLGGMNGSVLVVNNGSFSTAGLCATSTCDDFIFTNGTETFELSREFGNITSANSTSSTIYVCADTVNASGNNAYNYYSNSAATPHANTLSQCTSYLGVWHFDVGTGKNSITGIDNVTLNDAVYNASGKFGGTITLPRLMSTPPVISASSSMSPSAMTVEMWVRPSRLSSNPKLFQIDGAQDINMQYSSGNNRINYAAAGTALGTTPLVVGQWSYVVFVINSTATQGYMNGAQDGAPTVGSVLNIAGNFILGCQDVGAGCAVPFFGEIDEFRVSNFTRSEAYIANQYKLGINKFFNVSGATQSAPAIEKTTPEVDSIGIIPGSGSVANTSTTAGGITGFVNYTEFRQKNGTVYFVWAKNNASGIAVMNYSTMSAVPATYIPSYTNVSTIFNYTMPLLRNDVLTLVANATNGTTYSLPINTSITIGNFIPTTPPVSGLFPTNNTIDQGITNKTLICGSGLNRSVDADPDNLTYEFYAAQAGTPFSISPVNLLQNTTSNVFNFQSLNVSKYYWTCRVNDNWTAVSQFSQNMSFTLQTSPYSIGGLLPNSDPVCVAGLSPCIVANTSTTFRGGIGASLNVTDYGALNMTVYWTWAKNGILNYSMQNPPIPVTNSNVTSTLNWTAPLLRGDTITAVANATNGLVYIYSNSTDTVGDFPPFAPDLLSPANQTNYYLTTNTTIFCGNQSLLDIDTQDNLTYEFYVGTQNPVLINPSNVLQNSSTKMFNFQVGTNSSQFFWTCRATDNFTGTSPFTTTRSFFVNNTLIINQSTLFKGVVVEKELQNMSFTYVYVPQNILDTNLTLIYNNTVYGYTSKNQLASDTVRYTVLVETPIVETNGLIKSFRPNLSMSLSNGSTLFNSSYSFSQVVGQLNITDCTETVPSGFYVALNFSMMDEPNRTTFINSSFQMTLALYQNGTPEHNKTFTFDLAGKQVYTLCFPNNQTGYANAKINYFANGRDPRQHYFNNRSINQNTEKNVALRTLDISLATGITFFVVDEVERPIPGTFIKVDRQDVGQGDFYNVAWGLSDNPEGKDLIFLRKNDVFYVITLYNQKNEPVKITSPQKIIADNNQVTLKIGTASIKQVLSSIDGVSFTQPLFNNATRTFEVTYTDVDSSRTKCLSVMRNQNSSSNEICNTCSSSETNTFSCPANFTSGTLVGTFYVASTTTNPNSQILAEETITPESNFAKVVGKEGLVFASLMVLIAVGLSDFSLAYGILLAVVVIGLIWTIGIILLPAASTAFASMALTSVAIIYLIRRRFR